MREAIIKGIKFSLFAVVGYALAYMQPELNFLLSAVGISLPVLFLIFVGLGLIWAEFGALGLGFAIHIPDAFYIFTFACVITITAIRLYERTHPAAARPPRAPPPAKKEKEF